MTQKADRESVQNKNWKNNSKDICLQYALIKGATFYARMTADSSAKLGSRWVYFTKKVHDAL